MKKILIQTALVIIRIRRVLLLMGGVLLLIEGYLLCSNRLFWQFAGNNEWKCNNEKYIGVALGFAHDGDVNKKVPAPINEAVINPGSANEELAKWIKDNANCFSEIYTQRAISDVWLRNQELDYSYRNNPTEGDYGLLKGTETKIYQMHKHNPQIESVRTLEAIRCTLDRLDNLQEKKIVLIAHDQHYLRAFWDLQSMYNPDNIINPYIKGISYPKSQSPFCWTIWDSAAKAIEFGQRLDTPKCREKVTLR